MSRVISPSADAFPRIVPLRPMETVPSQPAPHLQCPLYRPDSSSFAASLRELEKVTSWGGCWQHGTSGGEGCGSRLWFWGLAWNRSLRQGQKTPPAFFPVRSLSLGQHHSCVEELSRSHLFLHYFWVLDVMSLLDEKALSPNHPFSC